MACCFFSACNFAPSTNSKISISGKVYLNSVALQDVQIKTASKSLCTSNNNGEFSFETNKQSITIFAEKNGYTFLPESITLTQNTNDIVFVAYKVEPLDGVLSLNSINITPSSIISMGDNYQFVNSGNNCLKIKNVNIK